MTIKMITSQTMLDVFLKANPTAGVLDSGELDACNYGRVLGVYDLAQLHEDTNVANLQKLAEVSDDTVQQWLELPTFKTQLPYRKHRIIRRVGRKPLNAYTRVENPAWKFNNPAVNDGLPLGISFETLNVGVQVEIAWRDIPNSRGIIVGMPNEKPEGDWSIDVLHLLKEQGNSTRTKPVYDQTCISQRQIVRIGGYAPILLDARPGK